MASKTKTNTSICIPNWLIRLLNKEEARCVMARDIIHDFLNEMRKIHWESVMWDVNGKTIFTTYLTNEDLDFMRLLKEKKIFFSLSAIARYAFWEHYRLGSFRVPEPKDQRDYLEKNGIKILRVLNND